MTPAQRAAAERLAAALDDLHSPFDIEATVTLLRELAAEPQGEPVPGMSLMNRTIAYCAADTLRKLGYEWNGEAWLAAEPVRECADNDSPWLICKPCAPTYTEQQIADACMAAEVPDSKCESVLLALRA